MSPHDPKGPLDTRARTLVRDAVKRVLSDAGFADKEHNPQIQAALGVTESAARRKLNMEVGWSDTDLGAIARHVNQPVEALFAIAAGQAKRPATAVGGGLLPARINIGGKAVLDCLVEPGQALQPGDHSELVLVEREPKVWHVLPMGDLPAGGAAKRIHRLVIEPSQTPPRTIGVLDDDEGVLDIACAILRQRRFDPVPYRHIADLRRDLHQRRFDVLVLDWWVRGESVEGLIREIRQSPLNAGCTLAVVTGELVAGGRADEGSLERLMSELKIKAYLKPVRWALVAADLANAAARREGQG